MSFLSFCILSTQTAACSSAPEQQSSWSGAERVGFLMGWGRVNDLHKGAEGACGATV